MVRFVIIFMSIAIIASCYGKSIKFVDQSVESKVEGEDIPILPIRTLPENIQDPFDAIKVKDNVESSSDSESNETPILPPLRRPNLETPKISELSEDPFGMS